MISLSDYEYFLNKYTTVDVVWRSDFRLIESGFWNLYPVSYIYRTPFVLQEININITI